MPSIFDPPDPVKRARGKAFMKRFKSPEGVSEGILGSFVGSIIEWRESGTKLSHKEFTSKAIDKAMGLSPAPTPTAISSAARQQADYAGGKLRKKAGRKGTIITSSGLGVADVSKSVLLGGSK